MRTDLLSSEERAHQQVGVRHEDTQRQLDHDLVTKQEKTRARQRQGTVNTCSSSFLPVNSSSTHLLALFLVQRVTI